MREWHRLFFVNRRRLAELHRGRSDRSGQPGHPAHRLSQGRLPGGRLAVPVACPRGARTRSRAAHGPLRADVVARLVAERPRRRSDRGPAPASRECHRQAARSIARPARARYSGGADWMSVTRADAAGGRRSSGDRPRHLPAPLVAADVMVTDHSSAGFEYCCSTSRSSAFTVRPCCRWPTSIPTMWRCSRARRNRWMTCPRSCPLWSGRWRSPGRDPLSERAVAADLFYQPGAATRRAMERSTRHRARRAGGGPFPRTMGGHACQPSA